MVSFINTLKYWRYKNIQSFLSLFPISTEIALGDPGKKKQLQIFARCDGSALAGCWTHNQPLHHSPFLYRTGRENTGKKLRG